MTPKRFAAPANMVVDYDRTTAIAQCVKWQIVGIGLLICHVLLVKISLVLYPVMILLVGWLYARASIAGILVYFQILLYQNLVISVFTTDMDYLMFAALQGTNFIALMAMGTIAALRLLPRRQQHRAIYFSISIALVLAVLYTLFGLAQAGFTPAMTYFRFFTGTIFAGMIGLDVGRVWSFRTIGLCFLYSAAVALMVSMFEYYYPLDFYGAINAVEFNRLKYFNQPKDNKFFSPEDIVRQFTTSFFNISGTVQGEYGFNNFRFGGSIMNPISNAYIMGVLAVLAVALKRSVWLVVLIPMLVAAGAKGALLLLVLSLTLYCWWVMVRNRRLLLIGSLCVMIGYISFGIYAGLQSNDYHVLGFLGGVRSLLHNPIGHGIGVGGNLSVKADNFNQQGGAGFRSANFDFALESAVGVLFYQMGAASAAVLAVFVTFLAQAPLGRSQWKALPVRSDIMYFALALIAINGIFQEEAYAPYASGLVMLLASVLIGNQRQAGVPMLSTRRSRRLAVA